MTKKDYELIAYVLENEREDPYARINAYDNGHDAKIVNNVLDLLTESFAQAFQRENSRFNRDKFLAACKTRIGQIK